MNIGFKLESSTSHLKLLIYHLLLMFTEMKCQEVKLQILNFSLNKLDSEISGKMLKMHMRQQIKY